MTIKTSKESEIIEVSQKVYTIDEISSQLTLSRSATRSYIKEKLPEIYENKKRKKYFTPKEFKAILNTFL